MDRPDASINVEFDAAPDIHYRDLPPPAERPPCTPTVTTCNPPGGQYCGDIGDGCEGTIHCGDCTAPETCGGTGIPNVCGDPACVPRSCSVAGGQYCGNIGDGCGHNLACGDCPTGMTCNGATHVCVVPGCSPTLTSCTVSGANYCGVVGDGCSGMVRVTVFVARSISRTPMPRTVSHP